METQDKVAEKTEILVPFNILPLDPDSANQAIMRFPEVWSLSPYVLLSCSYSVLLVLVKILVDHSLQIQAAVYALRNTRGLAWPKDYKKKKDEDILDWLGVMFGFQVRLSMELFTSLSIWVFYWIWISWKKHDVFVTNNSNSNCLPLLVQNTEAQCSKSERAFDLITCKRAHQTISQAWSTAKGRVYLNILYRPRTPILVSILIISLIPHFIFTLKFLVVM